jgi:hypothetical protein
MTMTPLKLYTLTPRYPRSRFVPPQTVVGFREAIEEARRIAARECCRVIVRNEADCHTWFVDFRVRGGRGPRGARCEVEVTR